MASSHKDDTQATERNQRGGSGVAGNDPQKASEAGKKIGQQSHSGQQQADHSTDGQRGGSDDRNDNHQRDTDTAPKGGKGSQQK